jgi:flagellar basal body rod protein FlgG
LVWHGYCCIYLYIKSYEVLEEMLDGSYYALVSKQMAVVYSLDVINNNVAQSNTPGFKEDIMLFRQYHHRDVQDNHTMSGPAITATNFANGAVKLTSEPLDCAINGPGFFIIRMPSGAIGYTRNGHFKRSADGVLVTADDYPVLSVDGQEIIFTQEDLDPRIHGDGSVMVQGEARGQIGMVEFGDLNAMKKAGSSIFLTEQAPLAEGSSKVLQGALEEANVNSLMQLTILANSQRDMAQVTHLVNEGYAIQRNAFKIYSKNGG